VTPSKGHALAGKELSLSISSLWEFEPFWNPRKFGFYMSFWFCVCPGGSLPSAVIPLGHILDHFKFKMKFLTAADRR
jgi:hypothetical protein